MVEHNKMQDKTVTKDVSKTGRLRKVANLRMLVITLVMLALIVPISHAWHVYQVYRTSSALLDQADALEKEEKWGEAAAYLDRYLQIVPDDIPAEIRLAKDYDKSAKDSMRKLRAIERYQVLLGELGDSFADEQNKVKSRLVALFLETYPPKYVEAEVLADELIENDKDNAPAWRAKALALHEHHRTGTLPVKLKAVDSVSEAFELAIALNPTDADLSRVLAIIYRGGSHELLPEGLSEDERKKKADETIDALISASPDDAAVYLLRNKYRREYKLDGAEADLQRALELGPEEYNIRIAVGAAAESDARRLRASRNSAKAEDKIKEAIEHYKHAIEIDPQVDDGYIQLGNLYREQKQTDKAVSTWKEGLEKTGEQNLALNAFLADLLIENGQIKQAGKALDRLDAALRSVRHRVRTPQLRNLEASQNFLRGRWHLAMGDPAKAIPLLKQVTIDPGSTPTEISRTLKAWILSGKAYGALGKWEEAAGEYEKAIRLEPQYINAYTEAITAWFAAGKPKKAAEVQKKLERLCTSNPSDQQPILALTQLALLHGDYENLGTWAEKLKQVEGEDGHVWKYYRARHLLAKAKDSNDPLLKEAGKLAAEIRAKQPDQSSTFLVAGLLAQREGKPEDAIAAYRKAMDLGDRTIFIHQNLIRLLIGTGQPEAAQKLLDEISGKVPLNDELTKCQIIVHAQQGKPNLVREVLQKALAARPNDPQQHQRIGRLLESEKKFAEAEVAYRKAVELAPDNIVIEGELFRFYVASKQPKKAEEVLSSIAGNSKIDELQRTLAVAACQEMLGKDTEAEASYRKAVESAPDNSIVKARLVRFLLSRPSKEKWEEAKGILEGIVKKHPNSVASRRALARVKASLGSEKDRKEACDILESLAKNPEQVADIDHRYLAGLYESQADTESAKKEYLKLVNREKVLPRDMATYVSFLLRNKSADEAGPWLDRLEKEAPNEAQVVALRVNWLHSQGRDDEIDQRIEKMHEQLLKKAGDDKSKQILVSLVAGNLYSSVGKFTEAEKHYRKLVKESPQNVGPLASAIAKQGRRLEAVKLCVEAIKNDDSVYPAVALSSILLAAKPSKEELVLADPVLNEALDTHKNNLTLLTNMATLRVIQGQTDQAAELYKKVLDKNPDDITILNNLASIQGEDPKTRAEAIKLVDRAIGIAGPLPSLHDTKATILLYDDKSSDAIKLLEKATSASDPDPRYFFHLALAYQKSGNMDKAKTAYGQAEKRGLKNNILTPNEHALLIKLEQDLKKK